VSTEESKATLLRLLNELNKGNIDGEAGTKSCFARASRFPWLLFVPDDSLLNFYEEPALRHNLHNLHHP
jgi:hypothetical protein